MRMPGIMLAVAMRSMLPSPLTMVAAGVRLFAGGLRPPAAARDAAKPVVIVDPRTADRYEVGRLMLGVHGPAEDERDEDDAVVVRTPA